MLAKQHPQAVADLGLAVLRTGMTGDERDAELLRPVLRTPPWRIDATYRRLRQSARNAL